MNMNRRLLLHGAIRKDKGNGLQFYKALEAASEDDLRSALEELSGKYGARFGYYAVRKRAIEKKLLEGIIA